MKILKWGLVVAVTFAAAWVLIFTFIQEPFKAAAPVKLLWYVTPQAFPMYVFVAATFAVGLFIGFFAAAYYYIAGQAGIHSKKKEIRRLEDEISEKDAEIESLRAAAGQAKEKITESLRSMGEKDLFA
jgi:uncharacterized membrane protein YciS (DUF1049 family)